MAGEILYRLMMVILLIVSQLPVSYLIVKFLIYEDGPSDGFRKLRRWVGIKEYEVIDEDGNKQRKREIARSWWGSRVLYCYNCLSPYVCIVIAIAAAHLASAVTQITIGESTVQIGEGIGLTLLGLVTWLPLTGLTVMAFDVIGTP